MVGFRITWTLCPVNFQARIRGAPTIGRNSQKSH